MFVFVVEKRTFHVYYAYPNDHSASRQVFCLDRGCRAGLVLMYICIQFHTYIYYHYTSVYIYSKAA